MRNINNSRMLLYKLMSIFVILILAAQTVSTTTADVQGTPIITSGSVIQGSTAGATSIGSLAVTTDKRIYYLGEPVKITVKNGLSQPINFNEIMVKNMMTGVIINVNEQCSPDPNVMCPAIAIAPTGPIIVDSGQAYTITWYPPSKGTYKAYIDWWTEGTVTCMAIGCPEPEPGISGTIYSNYFRIR